MTQNNSSLQKKRIQKKAAPQTLVFSFVATVEFSADNAAYAEDLARIILKNKPELWKLESLHSKPAKRRS